MVVRQHVGQQAVDGRRDRVVDDLRKGLVFPGHNRRGALDLLLAVGKDVRVAQQESEGGVVKVHRRELERELVLRLAGTVLLVDRGRRERDQSGVEEALDALEDLGPGNGLKSERRGEDPVSPAWRRKKRWIVSIGPLREGEGR